MVFISVFIIPDDSVDKLVAVGFCCVAISVVTSAVTAMEVVVDYVGLNRGKNMCR